MGTSKRYMGKVITKSAAVYGESSSSFGGEAVQGTGYKVVKNDFKKVVANYSNILAKKLLIDIINKSGGATIIASCLSPELSFVYGVIGTWYGLDIEGFEWVKALKSVYTNREQIYDLIEKIDAKCSCMGNTKSEVVSRKAMYEVLEKLQFENDEETQQVNIKRSLSEYVSNQIYYQILNDLEYLIELEYWNGLVMYQNSEKIRTYLVEIISDIVKLYTVEFITHNKKDIYEIILKELESRLNENCM